MPTSKKKKNKETRTRNKNLLVQPPEAGVSGGGGGNGFFARLGRVPKPTFFREPPVLEGNKIRISHSETRRK